MKERLEILLDREHLSASKFADLIGVQRSSVSHILTGRNKPSFDFLQKTLKAFPSLNADWLILAEGPMYEGVASDQANTLIKESVSSQEEEANSRVIAESSELKVNERKIEMPEVRRDKTAFREDEQKQVVRVMMFYDDGTFSTFDPSE